MTWRTAPHPPGGEATTAAYPAGPRTPRGAARRAGAAAVLLAAALLTGCAGTSDAAGGSAPAADLDEDCRATKSDAGLEVTLTVAPCPPTGGGSAGTAGVTVKDADGKAVAGAKVEINPEMPNMKMKGGNQTARPKGDGYEAKLVLGMAGDWRITVTVTPASGEASTTAFDLTAKG
ncbi:FixH family protein [Streptomyces sp. NPDC007346]|uniref:FixH family protein n=1 Tax=Streptomyces sp. NPDC007346 TaxID=3154682 RepID=UPI00345150D1